MLENTIFCHFSRVLFLYFMEDWEYKEQAAEALKLTATDMKKSKLIDKIIKEPLGGAHYDREATFDSVKAEIIKTFKVLDKLSPQELVDQRRDKFDRVFKD